MEFLESFNYKLIRLFPPGVELELSKYPCKNISLLVLIFLTIFGMILLYFTRQNKVEKSKKND